MSVPEDFAQFVDEQLYAEATEERALAETARLGTDLEVYGASVGAVRGTVRNALRRWPDLGHDDLTATASKLWERPVQECRRAAVVLLQTRLDLLVATDLTRIEGFLRTTDVPDLVDPLAHDVVHPLIEALDPSLRPRAETVLTRWRTDPHPSLRRAAAPPPANRRAGYTARGRGVT